MNECTYTRELGEPTVYFKRDESSQSILSRDDMRMYLGRATARFTYSLFTGKRVLPPNHRLLLSGGQAEIERSSSPVDGRKWAGVTEEIIAKSIQDSLRESVNGLAKGHQKIGLFLSGGLDSSILAYLLRETTAEIICYVCQFPDVPATDETRFAKLAADSYGLKLRVVQIDRTAFTEMLEQIVSLADRPLTCWSAIPQLAVSQCAKQDGCDVLFSGVGSDELFTGYSLMGRKYKAFLEYQRLHGETAAWEVLLGPPCSSRTDLLFIGNATPFPYESLLALLDEPPPQSFFEDDTVEFYRELHQRRPEADIASLMSAWEAEVRTSEILYPDYRIAEKLSGMKVLYPFYTTAMVNAFNNIPLSLRFKFSHEGTLHFFPKMYQGIDKYILRLAFQDILPTEIQARERMAFSAPFAWWILDATYLKQIERRVVSHSVWDQIGVRSAEVSNLFKTVNQPTLQNQFVHPFQVWLLYMICAWVDRDNYSKIEVYGE